MIGTLLVVFLITVAYLIKSHYDYWKKRGVPGPKPWLLVGNMGPNLFMKKSMLDVFADIYKEYNQYPIVGFFRANTPGLIICDPELIKDVTVKYFQHFHDNEAVIDKDVDPIFGRNPFFLKGEEWKTVRAQLTPGFTSGKMKMIYPHLEQTSEQLVNFIEKQALGDEGYEAKELCSRFTLNNVASCAFGLEGKCFEDDNSSFRQLAKAFLTPAAAPVQNFLFLLSFFFPVLNKIIKLKFVPQEVDDKLTAMITEAVKYRQENNIVRNDFLHILQELKKNCTAYKFTDVDVTAHAAGFLIDGFETSATVMSFALYELAANPEAQEKLRSEINQHFEDNDGKLPYDLLQNLPYLDAVFNESVRKHSPVPSLLKMCTKPYTYQPREGDGIAKSVLIEKGTLIVIPTPGLQKDPKYFKNPEKFHPDRFLGENKDNITKYTFIPFGEGPRACLGQRFGILQIKIGMAYVIKNYQISVNQKTKSPIKYDPLGFITAPVGGL